MVLGRSRETDDTLIIDDGRSSKGFGWQVVFVADIDADTIHLMSGGFFQYKKDAVRHAKEMRRHTGGHWHVRRLGDWPRRPFSNR